MFIGLGWVRFSCFFTGNITPPCRYNFLRWLKELRHFNLQTMRQFLHSLKGWRNLFVFNFAQCRASETSTLARLFKRDA
ncbi:Uncharacterised protein [Vibrio cholerae]|nr:Uncharacterised protein [Vibrio cholerae]